MLNTQPREDEEDKDEATIFKEENGENVWSMSGDFICEVPRKKCYVPTDETILVPMKLVDVMRQLGTNINSAAEHTIDDYWTEGIDASLSEDWIGTTRFQILRTKIPEGHKCVNGRPTTIQKTTRPDKICREEWPRLSKKQTLEPMANWDEEETRLHEACRKKILLNMTSR